MLFQGKKFHYHLSCKVVVYVVNMLLRLFDNGDEGEGAGAVDGGKAVGV